MRYGADVRRLFLWQLIIKFDTIATCFLHSVESLIRLLKEGIAVSLLGKSHAHA